MIRPKGMSQGEFAAVMRENGFPACSSAAVSLAERSEVSGVQFTRKARETAQRAFKSTRRQENRKHGAKTTVWFDEETRIWLEQMAYLEDTNVGEIVRKAVELYRNIEEKAGAVQRSGVTPPPAKPVFDAMGMADVVIGHYVERKAASDVGASEAAGRK